MKEYLLIILFHIYPVHPVLEFIQQIIFTPDLQVKTNHVRISLCQQIARSHTLNIFLNTFY